MKHIEIDMEAYASRENNDCKKRYIISKRKIDLLATAIIANIIDAQRKKITTIGALMGMTDDLKSILYEVFQKEN